MSAASLALNPLWPQPSLLPLRAIRPPMETASADSTQQLLHRIRAGDDAARERLLARYLPMLRRWAHGRLPSYARDLGDPRPDPALPRAADLIVGTKADLVPARRDGGTALPGIGAGDVSGLSVSALTGERLDELRGRLSDLAFGSHGGAEALALSARHREQIEAALASLEAAGRDAESPSPPAEILALHLREALNALGAIIGTVSPDELLGRIFGRFCIGK